MIIPCLYFNSFANNNSEKALNMTTEDTHKNMMSYLRQADATFRNGFENKELQQIFLKNTFDEISGSEVKFCLQKSFSFILEGMIKQAELGIVVSFFDSVKSEWVEIAQSQAGCHVLESVYERMLFCIHQSKLKSDDVLMKKIGKFASVIESEDDLSALIKDMHSTHAVRSHLQMLGGVLLPSTKDENKNANVIRLEKENIPKGFLKKLRILCESLCKMDDRSFVELLSDPHASPCVARFLQIIGKRHMPKTLRLICDKIMSCCRENTLFVFMKDKHASHVFESLLQHGTVDVKKEMQKFLCKDEKMFFDLCVHPVANYVIQKFICCFEDEDGFKEVFEFVMQGLEDVMSGQNYGIVQKLCEQCIKFDHCQKGFYDKLLHAFHCKSADDRSSLILLLATLRTHDSLFTDDANSVIQTVEYHGAMLLQTLLKFKNIGLLVKSMCSIPIQNIVVLSCDSSGSHFVDAFFTSDKVKFKIKRDLIKKMEDEWVKIACNKYGSRVLENIWDLADITIKRLLAEVLVKSSAALSEDAFGKFVNKKCQLKRYETRLEEWESVQKQLINKRKMFAGIIPEPNAKKSKNRRV